MPDVARIRICGTADKAEIDPHRSGQIAHAEDQQFHPRARLRDRLDILHALDFLDQHLDADLAVEADGAFDLAEQRGDEVNVVAEVTLVIMMVSRWSPAPSTTSMMSR